LLHWGQFLGIVCARLEAWRLTELLRKHCLYSGGGSIIFNQKWNMGIWMVKDGGSAKGSCQVVECFVGADVPGQGLGLSSE